MLSWLWTSKFTSQGPAVFIWAIRRTDPLVPYYPNTPITLIPASMSRKSHLSRPSSIRGKGAFQGQTPHTVLLPWTWQRGLWKTSLSTKRVSLCRSGKLCRPIQPPVPSAQEEEPKRWTWVLRESRDSLLGDRRTEEFRRAALPAEFRQANHHHPWILTRKLIRWVFANSPATSLAAKNQLIAPTSVKLRNLS